MYHSTKPDLADVHDYTSHRVMVLQINLICNTIAFLLVVKYIQEYDENTIFIFNDFI